ncbi:hypothetical protein CHLRE_16g690543v5 [Chlamydomonas reinhardtii]|uniref:Uncharacterized protein n=1 Tax=Chlamydomonas reinhardtii TaxID=3055 RepID=A0A2K3CW90_CHLRE|nr:uncharacterized protein CHLRE_16g690543v5 [Chlamydomonas reinhardtii]PNW72549.1 hypothetical protein CHLRE_16g690543v5 [Chlamydomonas reinhardtii]
MSMKVRSSASPWLSFTASLSRDFGVAVMPAQAYPHGLPPAAPLPAASTFRFSRAPGTSQCDAIWHQGNA